MRRGLTRLVGAKHVRGVRAGDHGGAVVEGDSAGEAIRAANVVY